VLWTSIAATVTAVVLALPSSLPNGPAEEWALVVLAGVAYTAATTLWMLTIRSGHVALVTPIVSTDGAIAALIAVAAGATLSTVAGIALAGMVLGILLVARDGAAPGGIGAVRGAPAVSRSGLATVGLAIGSAFCFGVVFVASGEVEEIDPMWVVALARAMPALAFSIALVGGKRAFPPHGAWRWIVPCGLLDVTGYVAFVYGAQKELAVAAVAASQYAAMAAIAGILLFGERISRRQLAGITVLVVSVGVVASQGG